MYFTVTVSSTVSFTPKSEAARIVLIVQMLGDLAVLGVGARVVLGAERTAGNKDRYRRRPGRYLTARPAKSGTASS